MKTKIVIGTGLAILITAFALMDGFQGEESTASAAIPWKKFDEGVLLAKKENKKIIVDVYTDWCSWCKKMDKEVYGNPAISKMLSKNFISVKLNPEASEQVTFEGRSIANSQFAQNFGVTGYPTTLFLDSEMKPITILPGYVTETEFRKILTYIGENHYKSMSFDQYRSTASKE
ncbi:MAG: thioredoxin fold domain-containing protein [bacterium]